MDTRALAKKLVMDGEELRRILAELSLPCPRECLGWGRLFFALGMAEIRGETVSRLAFRLGYGDRSSLCRLCRRLTDRPATELFSPEGDEVAISALAKRLVG
jgi:AraC-like DNA-binding protein